MLYALLNYGSEDVFAEVSFQKSSTTDSGTNKGDLSPGVLKLDVQLLPTATAVTVRSGLSFLLLMGHWLLPSSSCWASRS
jgi:hypothetical protein